MFKTLYRQSMKFRLAASLGCAILLPGAALAETAPPELYFYPATPWDYKTIEKKERSICSIAAEMNNGFILQITGSDKRFQSLNLNFRQNVFQEQDSLNVTLSVPGVIQKTLPAYVAKPELLAIDTKTSQDLIAEIRNANVLDVFLGKNAFRFYLTGLSQNFSAFDECLGLQRGTPVATLHDQSSSEPVLDAPSFDAKAVAADAQKQYEDEMASLIGTASQTDTTAQVPMQDISTKSPPADHQERALDELSKKPAPRSGRFTERLAAEMAKADGDSLEGGIKIPKASSEIVEPTAAVKPEEPELNLQELKKAAMDEKSSETESITWNQDSRANAAAVQFKAEEIAPAAPTETAPKAPSPAALNTVDKKEIILPPLDADLVSTDAKVDPAPEAIAETPAVQDEKPDPTKHSIKTPPPTINKYSETVAADFTHAGLEDDDSATDLPAMELTITPKPSAQAETAAMRELRQEVRKLRAENVQLNKELKKALRAAEKERLDISSDNWNLEQATMRYNEAERQIAALGQKIQKERAQWQMEKAELEMMLFDPAVTEQAQLARLATLEQQLSEAKAELEAQRKEYEERLRSMGVQLQRGSKVSQ